VLTLGRIAFEAYLNHLKRQGLISNKKAFAFEHAAEYSTPDGRLLQVRIIPRTKTPKPEL